MIVDIDDSGINQGYNRGLVPVLSLPPNADLIRQKMQDILDLTQGTVDDIKPVFSTWQEIEGNYVAADSGEVLEALDQDSRNLSAIQEAGRVIAGALSIYADFCDGYSESYNSYMERVVDLVSLDRRWADLPGTDMEKIESHPELQEQIAHGRMPLMGEGQGLQNDFEVAQVNLHRTLDSIDMESLARFQFTSREAGLDAATSQEELELMIMESDAFGDELTLEQVRTLASSVDIDALPYDYVDEQGRRWVTTADGTKVRAGSAMDPNLTAAIITAMAEDPEMSTIELPAGTDEHGEEQSVPVADIASFILTTADDAGAGPYVANYSKGLGMWGVVTAAGDIHTAGVQGRDAEQLVAPLMSDADLDEVEVHYQNKQTAKTGVSTVVALPVDAAATAVAPFVGPGAYVVSYMINDTTGEVVDVVVEKVLDDTWSEKELARKGERAEEVDAFDRQEYERRVAARLEEEGLPEQEPVGPVHPDAPEDPYFAGVPGDRPPGQDAG